MKTVYKEVQEPRREAKHMGKGERTYDWPYVAKLHAELEFTTLIKRMIATVRADPTVPIGCFSDGKSSIYMLDEKLYDVFIRSLLELAFRREQDIQIEKLDKTGEDYDWREVINSVQEALMKRS